MIGRSLQGDDFVNPILFLIYIIYKRIDFFLFLFIIYLNKMKITLYETNNQMKGNNAIILLPMHIILAFLIIIFLQINLAAINIEQEEKILLSENVILQSVASFCVTEDNQFLIVDAKAKDIKIYDKDGKLNYILGREGYGPDEFALPLFSHYNNGKFLVLDVQQNKIFFYLKT